ncbi:diguanylate cyclase [Faecalicatena contorta]|uniref:Diguanylate cyclase (GGDEF) domain-containing protein n=1 Tax=Faecalicatena contorta TaxID=39482 RepID=A0A316A0C9_9FIRM|nr:diguanylate cyclase [Faecalicatena contorta]PWJ50164.1 diguanylate cyclase (GGDEF)-like protein [Faecalicatena contorta]SUQ14285.1 diguanylate cyclase (GGDEF) domain-containing protein [Faecalicatena contorta]
MNIFIWFMLFSTVASVILLIYSVASHNSERSFFLIFTSFCGFLYTLGYLLEIISPTLESAFIGVRVQKMGSLLIVPLHYLFVRDVYGKKRFSMRTHCLLFALPVFNLFTAQAFPLVRLHYTDIEYFHSGLIANCQGYPGVVNYIAIVYNLFLTFLNLWLIIKHLRVGSRLQKRQSLCLLVSVLIPLFVNIYHTFSYDHLRIDLNPLAVSVYLTLLLYSVRTQNLLNVVPLARAQVIESMADAFIVCGKNFSFLDANLAARQLFPELNTLPPGETIEQVKQFEYKSELCLQIDGKVKFYKITQTPILQNNKISAVCIVLHDITDKENELKNLYEKATFDPLMHIYNRATFFDLADFMLNSDKAKNLSYALLMIDLDDFKLVNDTYTHSCGDIVLETIASIVKDHFFPNDIAGRYGGEEIVVLLEDMSVRQAIDKVEQLRKSIENTIITYQENKLCITVSIGIAHSPARSVHLLEDMLVQADSALYEAKNSGRNRAWMYGESPD